MTAHPLRDARLAAWKAAGFTDPLDVAVFVPFASVGCTTEYEQLEMIGLWMGHRHTTWWKNGGLPAGSEAKPYDQDGWCQFENHMGTYVKKSGRRIDLTPPKTQFHRDVAGLRTRGTAIHAVNAVIDARGYLLLWAHVDRLPPRLVRTGATAASHVGRRAHETDLKPAETDSSGFPYALPDARSACGGRAKHGGVQ